MSRNLAVERDREERAERQAAREEHLRNRVEGVDLSTVDTSAESPFRKATYAYDSLEEAFPEADPGLIPFGNDVLVQIRTPRTRSSGGIWLTEETRETQIWNTQVAKVVAYGPVAFRNRGTMEPWPECVERDEDGLVKAFHPWASIGSYVRVPKYGGDRWWVDAPSHPDGKALFVLFTDLDLKGQVPEDKVLDVVAYI